MVQKLKYIINYIAHRKTYNYSLNKFYIRYIDYRKRNSELFIEGDKVILHTV